jgi:pyruvate,orthophosphate dikinase
MARRPSSQKKPKAGKPAKARGKAAGPSVKKSAKKATPVAGKSGKWVYPFGGGKAEGRTEMRDLLGGKGANLAEMANLGLPVPPGFTITTAVCTHYYANAKKYP